MIASLTGTVTQKEDKSLIISASGVGYRVYVLSALLGSAQVSDEISLAIHHHITSEAQTLFGFTARRDQQFFELLLSVPSIGPRTALHVLDVAPPDVLGQAVADKDIQVLTKISGIGKKTAERILIELQEKIDIKPSDQPMGEVHSEVISVLVNLGYSKSQAKDAVTKLPRDITDAQTAVKTVLQSHARP